MAQLEQLAPAGLGHRPRQCDRHQRRPARRPELGHDPRTADPAGFNTSGSTGRKHFANPTSVTTTSSLQFQLSTTWPLHQRRPPVTSTSELDDDDDPAHKQFDASSSTSTTSSDDSRPPTTATTRSSTGPMTQVIVNGVAIGSYSTARSLPRPSLSRTCSRSFNGSVSTLRIWVPSGTSRWTVGLGPARRQPRRRHPNDRASRWSSIRP